jgi:hypothetical protein
MFIGINQLTKALHSAFSSDLATSNSHLFRKLKAVLKISSFADKDQFLGFVMAV